MHGITIEEHLASISSFLGIYYLALAAMNATAALYLWRSGRSRAWCNIPILDVPFTSATFWLLVSMGFTCIAPLALTGNELLMPSIPKAVRDASNAVMGPVVYTVGSLVVLGVLYWLRRLVVRPFVAWSLFNIALLVMGLSMTDREFAAIVTKADNVPIVGLIYLLGFFTWLGAYKAVQNDDRARDGLEPLEKEDNEKILVWPDLVYTELICMVALTALLMFWAILLQAPLEEPASSVKTPNPSKAPWYFLGLQEMLVYYDPWMAGVVLPSLVVFGLMAIPFIDFNKQGNGYYTIDQRRFAYLTFQFGFLVLWVTLIVMGTFLRGPNWNFFGFFEYWDAHKVEALNNVDLSEYFWNGLLHMPRPKPPSGSGTLVTIGYILIKEAPGIVLLVGYLIFLPPALALMSFRVPSTSFKIFGAPLTLGGFTIGFRKLFVHMGFIRYMVMMNLMLFMALLPIKMVARWSFNMKYFIAIPEFFLNF
ncbi:MAG: hypothetical protein RIC55_06240 [Pirellulaceae bacterium]